MKSVRNAFGACIAVLVLLGLVAVAVQPLLPYLVGLFFLASIFYIATRGR